MTVKIKKRSERFAESLDAFKALSIARISPINTYISELVVSLQDILKLQCKDKNQIEDILKLIACLEDSVEKLRKESTRGVDKLTKDYSWLKNKLGILEDERRNFKLLYELTSILENESKLDNLLQTVIDSTTDILDAEYGIVELIDDEGKVRLAKKSNSTSNNSLLLEFKDKVLDAAIDSGSSIIMNNLILKNKSSNGKRKIGSVMCLPLKSDETIIGTLYFGAYRKSFSVDETELLEALEERIAQAIANNIKYSRLVESRQKMLAKLRKQYDFSDVIGNSPQMATVLSIVADISDSDTAVLIEGESGTGKEVIARAIHSNSSRKEESFIPINCSAIPETLLESELFGYEKGAFTGAVGRKPGKFEQANGGTILLDEIGELSLTLQVKLLRFLQSHEFESLGSNKVVKSDVRIITATKRDLSKMVEAGEFRDDLYYRINVINIKIPPLRERVTDITGLVNHFIQYYAEKNNKEIDGIVKEALNLIEQYKFPGNVRELENALERAIVLCKSRTLSIDDLPDNIKSPAGPEAEYLPQNSHQLKLVKKRMMDDSVGVMEKNFLIRALRKAGGNVSEAARLTQMHRKQFQRMMERCELNPQDMHS
ncbi:MAG: GAF domain-containing protein [candidate division Zixibacteria bacterium]|nr:GAF domain-containing protein [candidate division Zixibacteria bacterium]